MLLLAAVTLTAYHGALDNQFTWDAIHYVVDNPRITAINSENIRWALTTHYFSNWHPVTWLSYMLDHQIYGGVSSFGFHLTNLLLHSINVALFFLLSYRLLTIHRSHQPNTLWNPTLAAFIAALLFAIHPQHVESVAWVAERKDLLFLLFTLAALLSYLNYSSDQKIRHYLLTLTFAILAMAAKPMAVSLPLILLLLDIYPLKRLQLHGAPHRWVTRHPNWRPILDKLPFVAIALFTVWMTLLAQSAASLNPTIEWGERLLNATSIYLSYLSKLLFPVYLSPLYPRDSGIESASHLPYLASFIALTLLALYTWYKKAPWWLLIWLFYLITLLPTVGIVQVGEQSSADRYSYLPLLPAYLLLGLLAARQLAPSQRSAIRLTALAALLLFSSLLFHTTQKQVEVWSDEFTLWHHVEIGYPETPIVLRHLADLYYIHHHYATALDYYQRHLEAGDFDSRLFARYALSILKTGQYSEAHAVYQWLLDPQIPTGISRDCLLYNSAWLALQLGDHDSAEQTLQQMEEAHRYPDLSRYLQHQAESRIMVPLCQQDPYGEAILQSIKKDQL